MIWLCHCFYYLSVTLMFYTPLKLACVAKSGTFTWWTQVLMLVVVIVPSVHWGPSWLPHTTGRGFCCFLSSVLIKQDRKEASQWGPLNSTHCARAITAALFSISLGYWRLSYLTTIVSGPQGDEPEDLTTPTETHNLTHAERQRLENRIVTTVMCVSVCECVSAHHARFSYS